MGNKIDNNKINIRKVRKEDLMDVSELVVNSWKTSYRGIINDDYLNSITAEETYQKRLKKSNISQ